VKTLLVTGAGRGIGAAVAELAAARGYRVVVNYAESERRARDVVDRIERAGGTAMAACCDVADERAVVAMFDRIDRTYGPVEALVNNAGVTGGGARVEDVRAATLERVLAVNVTGTVLCAREAVRRMSTSRGGRGGSIVNVSSIAARIGGGGEWVHYAVSKGAVDTFTIGLAREVAAEGIRVNAVAPGLIATEIHTTSPVPDRLERMTPGVPMQRAGAPAEVADVVLFLLSDAAAYVTGATVPVGGGR
jgi:NAD(P)-dependent dehydrogenase (short-subunit alcohol dehydrogenase family)